MRRGDLRDEGYDPHLFLTVKLGLQRSIIRETLWILLCLALVISLIVNPEKVALKYWGFLGQYMASLLAFYALNVYVLCGVYKRALVKTLRMKRIKTILLPVVMLMNGFLMVFAYDAIDFYGEVVRGKFFIIEAVALLIYAYIGVLSLFGLAIIMLLILSILTCQVNICALCSSCCCRRQPARQRRDEGGRGSSRQSSGAASQRRQQRLENRRQRESALGMLSRVFVGDEFNDHEECTICLEQFTDEDRVTPLPCDRRHYFHSKCIESWFRRKDYCPLCKETFSTQ